MLQNKNRAIAQQSLEKVGWQNAGLILKQYEVTVRVFIDEPDEYGP